MEAELSGLDGETPRRRALQHVLSAAADGVRSAWASFRCCSRQTIDETDGTSRPTPITWNAACIAESFGVIVRG
eukprot:4565823-Pleurochrysis_carterae.AAC.1